MAKLTRAQQDYIDGLEQQLATARRHVSDTHDRLEASDRENIELRNRLALAERKAENYQSAAQRFELAAARAEGWRDRVREEDAIRANQPLPRASPASLADIFSPEEMIDLALGAEPVGATMRRAGLS